MYALLMLKATGLGELIRNAADATTGRRSHDDSALLAQINATAFPEDALHLRGAKESGAKESAAVIEPVLQALRSIAKDPEALAGCGAAPRMWSLHDVRQSVSAVHSFLHRQCNAKTVGDKALLPKGTQLRWKHFREQFLDLLRDPGVRFVLADQLRRSSKPPEQPAARRLRSVPPPTASSPRNAPISDADAAAPLPRRGAPRGQQRGASRDSPSRDSLLKAAMRAMRDEVKVAEERMAVLELENKRLQAKVDRGVLNPQTLIFVADSLLAAVDASVANSARPLFAGGALVDLSREQEQAVKRALRLWHLDAATLDAALKACPECMAELQEAMAASGGAKLLARKVRSAFLKLNLLARNRAQKNEVHSSPLVEGLGVVLVTILVTRRLNPRDTLSCTKPPSHPPSFNIVSRARP